MPFKGYTTAAVPGRIFSPDEMLAYLASPQNATHFTYALGALALGGLRADTALSATVLTSTCPREWRLRQSHDYTLPLEDSFYSVYGTLFHAAVEQTAPYGPDHIRERRYAKRVTVGGKKIVIPGRLDELYLNYTPDGKACVVDYKTTDKGVPKYDTPYRPHLMQLSIYRWMLSDFGGRPLVLPERDGDAFWKAAEHDWVETAPVDVGLGMVVYRGVNKEERKGEAKKVYVGPGYAADFMSLADTDQYVRERLGLLLGEKPVRKQVATDPTGLDFGWKCEKYCAVSAACKQEWLKNELGDDAETAAATLRAAGWKVEQPRKIDPRDDF